MSRFRTILSMTACAVCLLSMGCMGGRGPTEKYLRVETPFDAGMKQAAMISGEKKIVAVKDFASLPALQRTAVLRAKGNVLIPSTSLYWEGTPAELATTAVVDAISARQGLNAAWPFRSRTEHDAVVSGSVTSFEVVESANSAAKQENKGTALRVRLRVDLWSRNSKSHLTGQAFDIVEPTGSDTPNAIAKAAERALSRTTQNVAAWIEDVLAQN